MEFTNNNTGYNIKDDVEIEEFKEINTKIMAFIVAFSSNRKNIPYSKTLLPSAYLKLLLERTYPGFIEILNCIKAPGHKHNRVAQICRYIEASITQDFHNNYANGIEHLVQHDGIVCSRMDAKKIEKLFNRCLRDHGFSTNVKMVDYAIKRQEYWKKLKEERLNKEKEEIEANTKKYEESLKVRILNEEETEMKSFIAEIGTKNEEYNNEYELFIQTMESSGYIRRMFNRSYMNNRKMYKEPFDYYIYLYNQSCALEGSYGSNNNYISSNVAHHERHTNGPP